MVMPSSISWSLFLYIQLVIVIRPVWIILTKLFPKWFKEFPKHFPYYTYSVSYYAIIMLMKMVTSNSCNINMSSLPDMYTRRVRPTHFSWEFTSWCSYHKSENFHMKIIQILNIRMYLFLWVYVTHKNMLTWTYFNTNIITIVLLILHMSISLLLINF